MCIWSMLFCVYLSLCLALNISNPSRIARFSFDNGTFFDNSTDMLIDSKMEYIQSEEKSL